MPTPAKRGDAPSLFSILFPEQAKEIRSTEKILERAQTEAQAETGGVTGATGESQTALAPVVYPVTSRSAPYNVSIPVSFANLVAAFIASDQPGLAYGVELIATLVVPAQGTAVLQIAPPEGFALAGVGPVTVESVPESSEILGTVSVGSEFLIADATLARRRTVNLPTVGVITLPINATFRSSLDSDSLVDFAVSLVAIQIDVWRTVMRPFLRASWKQIEAVARRFGGDGS